MGSTGTGANIFPSWAKPKGPPPSPFLSPDIWTQGLVGDSGSHPLVPTPAELAAGTKFSMAGNIHIHTLESCTLLSIIEGAYSLLLAGGNNTWSLSGKEPPGGAPTTLLSRTPNTQDPVWFYLTYNELGDSKCLAYTAGMTLDGAASPAIAGWQPFKSTRTFTTAGYLANFIRLGVWYDYILTPADAALLEGGWTP